MMSFHEMITQHVINCDTYQELKEVIHKYAPFYSYSRSSPKEWTEKLLLNNIGKVRKGGPIQLITRVNGLRAKVAELILSNNYDIPWD